MNELKILNFSGYAMCASSFGEYSACFNESKCSFENGLNLLEGAIDSAAWAISYAISMYSLKKDDFTLFENVEVICDDMRSTFEELNRIACYMDKSFNLFSAKYSVKELVEQGLKKQSSCMNANEIRDLFGISVDRFERPVSSTGNEKFRCMASIGYANNKSLFCFPWISKKLMVYYGKNITDVLETLDMLNTTVILPTEFVFSNRTRFKKIYRFDDSRDSCLYNW